MKIQPALCALMIPVMLVALFAFESKMQPERLFNLNHFYISIDRETFEAFRDHPELLSRYFEADSGMPEFGPVTDSTGIIYLRGETVYMELMGPDNRFNVAQGVTGIGFSEDTKLPLEDGWQENTRRLFDGMDLEFGKNTYTSRGEEISWFETAYVPDSETTIYTWYSRYNPDFLSLITDQVYSEYTREAYLRLARSGTKQVQNINSLTLSLTSDDFDRIQDELNAVYEPYDKTDTQNIYQAGDVTIRLIRAEDISRLAEVEFILQENHTCSYQVGTIIISCEDSRLRMRFTR